MAYGMPCMAMTRRTFQSEILRKHIEILNRHLIKMYEDPNQEVPHTPDYQPPFSTHKQWGEHASHKHLEKVFIEEQEVNTQHEELFLPEPKNHEIEEIEEIKEDVNVEEEERVKEEEDDDDDDDQLLEQLNNREQRRLIMLQKAKSRTVHTNPL